MKDFETLEGLQNAETEITITDEIRALGMVKEARSYGKDEKWITEKIKIHHPEMTTIIPKLIEIGKVNGKKKLFSKTVFRMKWWSQKNSPSLWWLLVPFCIFFLTWVFR